jgi:hypothetical protein
LLGIGAVGIKIWVGGFFFYSRDLALLLSQVKDAP